jgi:surface carbohydrate biosynthesis protein (TIGR04326 family)
VENYLSIYEDRQKVSKEKIGSIIYWNGYEESISRKEYSILQLVERNSDKLRLKYLSLIYDLGKLSIGNRNIIELLKVRNNFSYWSMTLLFEKCNFSKSPEINDIIKLMALEKWLKEKNYNRIIFFGSNIKLANAIELMSIKQSVEFRHTKSKKKKLNTSISRYFYRRLPHPIQATLWLIKYIFTRWPLRGVGLSKNNNTRSPSILFISYFDNLNPKVLSEKIYQSKYWGALSELLEDNSYSSNWIHIYAQDEVVKSPKDAAKLLNKFNNLNQKNHVFLDSFLSIGLLFSLLKDWLKIRNRRLVEKKIKFELGFYYPLLMSDIKKSLYGVDSISSLLFFNLFEKSMKYFPNQTKGFYLYEGQGWEYGFISAWKGSGSGLLTAVSHTPLKYWDLRTFFDSRLFSDTNNNLINFPDYLAVNGHFSKSLLVDSNYPKDRIIELEALRYGYLENISSSNKKLQSNCLLVVTDFQWCNTKFQLEILEKALLKSSNKFNVIIKTHPNCPIPENYKISFDYQVAKDTMENLLQSSDVVFSSNTTSASVDAYSANKRIIVMLEPNTLNLSPLKGMKEICFISTPSELSTAIDLFFNDIDIISEERINYFFLNKDLPKWKELLLL